MLSKLTKQTSKPQNYSTALHGPLSSKNGNKTPITAPGTGFRGSLVLIITDLVNQNTNTGLVPSKYNDKCDITSDSYGA